MGASAQYKVMVCATRITVVICLLVSGVRPENESSDTSAEIDEARIKRQENQFTQNFRFNNNVSPSTSAQLQQQLLNQQQLSSFRSRVGQSALGLGGNNRFASPSRFSGRTQNLVLTQGQLVSQNQQNSQRQVPQQSFQRFAPQQLTSPAPFQSNFQSSPVLLNNDPLGLFRGNSQGQRSTGTSPVNTRAGTVERLQPQTNFENLRQANGFQQPGFTPQQILNFQRQQLQQALAGIPGRNQNSIVPRQGVSFQRFSPSAPSAPQNTQAFRLSQQFQPSFQAQVPSQNNFQSNQVRQFQVQPTQTPQALPFVQQQVPQRPQANFFANQPRQVQQAIQPQQLQQAIQPQQLQQANQRQQIQQAIQPQQLQQQPQQLQLQQLQQQAIQPQQLQQQNFRSSQQLNQIQQQQAFLQQLLRRQQVINQLRQQQLQQQARGQIQQPTQTSPVSQPTPSPTTRQPVQRPTSSFSPSSFSTNTPRGSFGQPLPAANIPATQNAPASFGVPLQTTRQPIRQTANVQQTFRAPGQAASPPARPAAAAQTTFGVPLQTTANRLAQPVALSRPTSAPASFGVPLSPVQQPNQITSAQPTIQQQISQQLRQQQPQRSGVLLSQTRPQSSGIQSQAFSGAGGLVNTVSQLQQGRPTGGFTILRDDDDFNDRTDEINDSRERFLGGGGRLNSGGFTGASVGVPLRFNGVRAGVGSFTGAPSVGNNAVGGSVGTFSRASPVGIPLQFGGAAASAGNVFRPSSGGVPLGSSLSQGRTFNAIPLQIRPDITQEDITVEVNSREIFRPSSLRTSGGFQPSFGNRITRVGLDLTNENLTTEDRTLELFDD